MDSRTISDRRMSEEWVITVTDVYDQAAGIAQEFDKLITVYGNDSVTDLMPKVIKALEQLELLASRYEHENEEISQLKLVVEKLQAEKLERAQERARFEQELEQIEENWQSEVKSLLWDISKLQDANKKLNDHLHDTKQAIVEEVVQVHKRTEQEEIRVLTKLKETVDKQRNDLRTVKREMKQKTADCDALSEQLDRIAKVNAELRRKNNIHKKQAKALIEERADIEVQLKEKDIQVVRIKEMLTQQENYDAEKLAQEVRRKRSQSKGDDEDEVDFTDMNQRLHLEGKMIIDLADPDRPRFTMQELRQVLLERNELKTKLIEVEEELNTYKPKIVSKPPMSSYRGEEVLVFGPINREPDEKLSGRKEGGVRKFFSFLFGDGSPKPQRQNTAQRKRSSTVAQ
ncbi:RILP-like protein 1 isoform X3 [Gigantopelta aegis]|uniref:RILP-like protein 1 isoform X3 n=1 Tax=Gigantopelta aegis TaxID=1735272 RepID=UPI001B88B227|nr:RILP-like protein 1 isoform X3 [Gigantopelta aegis]